MILLRHIARITRSVSTFSLARSAKLPIATLPALALALTVAPRPAEAQKLPEPSRGPSVSMKALPREPRDQYVGIDRCGSCHKPEWVEYSPEYVEFRKTPHARIRDNFKPAMDCETCHGPGKAHSDAAEAAHGDDAKIAAANKLIFTFRGTATENAERCLVCHESSKQQEMFGHSDHLARGVSCNQCHTSHLVEAVKDLSKGRLSYTQAYLYQMPQLPEEVRWLHNSLLKEPQPTLCYSCHGTIRAQFALPVHHRVPEGVMKCTDCHSAHGSLNRSNLGQTVSETCVSCHTEKRGPFVFEHAGVKVEGCTTCHGPHGTTNRTLLVRREGRQLCLQCHTGFQGQMRVPHGRFGFQTSGECTRCHVTIHGSNFDEFYLR